MARWARAQGLIVLQPERVKEEAFLAELEALELDLAVVVAFGQIFPRRLLALPRLGCVNLHASLLPRYRGAAPIQAAIAAGDAVTGVTTMRMQWELDAGPILLEREVAIGPEETAGELGSRLARVGAELMVETIERLERGDLTPRPQEEGAATFAPRLDKEDGRVSWSLGAGELYNRLRAYTPWPGLTAELAGRPLKLVWARPTGASAEGTVAGTVLGIDGDGIQVACGDGSVLLLEKLQRPGKAVLAAGDFARGEHLRVGQRLGSQGAPP